MAENNSAFTVFFFTPKEVELLISVFFFFGPILQDMFFFFNGMFLFSLSI